MARRLYTYAVALALLLLAPLWLPVVLLRARTRRGLFQRLGVLPRETRRLALVGQGSLWLHAASLGEVNAVAPVARLLIAKLEGVPLVISCTTPAGVDRARALFPQAAAVFLLPLDLPWLLEPLLRRFRPTFAVIAETELWPNFLHLLKARGCQLLLANGRMSERSLKRYLTFRPLFSEALGAFDALAAQSGEDAARFLELGAKPSRVRITGNTKFDILGDQKAWAVQSAALRGQMGLKENAPLIVAGSTRPGEEGLLLAAFAELQKVAPALKLLLAPRHLERGAEVEALVRQAGLSCVRRTELRGKLEADVILLDTLGELAPAYGLGQLAWIGGSWQPFGGQNPLEASAQGLPVLFGPHMEHFTEVASALCEGKAALQVGAAELFEASRKLLKDRQARQAMGKAGQAVVRRYAGASERCAELAWKLTVMERLRRDERDWRSRSAFASMKVSEFGSSLDAED